MNPFFALHLQPMFRVGESDTSPGHGDGVGPTPPHTSSYIRSESWCSPYRAKRGSLKVHHPTYSYINFLSLDPTNMLFT